MAQSSELTASGTHMLLVMLVAGPVLQGGVGGCKSLQAGQTECRGAALQRDFRVEEA